MTEQRFLVARTVYTWIYNNLCLIRLGAPNYVMRDGVSWQKVRLYFPLPDANANALLQITNANHQSSR